MAAISLFVARFWLFSPSVSPVVLNSQERAEPQQKLEALESALMLAIGQGCTIEVSALGRDAMQTVQRITACLQEE